MTANTPLLMNQTSQASQQQTQSKSKDYLITFMIKILMDNVKLNNPSLSSSLA